MKNDEKFSLLAMGLGLRVDTGRDFHGREGILNIKASGSGRVLMGIRSNGKINSSYSNLRVQHDDLEIGWTGKVVWSERFGATVGLCFVDSGMVDVGAEVQLVGDGFILGCELVELPFVGGERCGIWG